MAFRFGTSSDNRLVGTRFRDIIRGNGGDDTISGGGGNDVIDAGVGNDLVYAALGNDRMLGNGGNDVMRAGAGNDYVVGGLGNNNLDDEIQLFRPRFNRFNYQIRRTVLNFGARTPDTGIFFRGDLVAVIQDIRPFAFIEQGLGNVTAA